MKNYYLLVTALSLVVSGTKASGSGDNKCGTNNLLAQSNPPKEDASDDLAPSKETPLQKASSSLREARPKRLEPYFQDHQVNKCTEINPGALEILQDLLKRYPPLIQRVNLNPEIQTIMDANSQIPQDYL